MTTQTDKPRALISPVGVLSYPKLVKPEQGTDDEGNKQGNPKFSAAIIFEAGADLSALKKSAYDAAVAKFGPEIKLPGGKTITIAKAFESGVLRSPFRDGETKGYADGSTFMNVRTERRPGAVRPDLTRVETEEEMEKLFYPGARVKISLSPYGYDRKGNKGVTFGLENIQFIGHGERLDNRVRAEDTFTAELDEVPADLSELGLG